MSNFGFQFSAVFFFLKSEIFSYIVGKVYLITKEHIFLGGDFVLKLFGRAISSF